jgi:hypothetical protein
MIIVRHPLSRRPCFPGGHRSGAAHQFHRRHLRDNLESGSLNICRLRCSSPFSRIMHSARQIGNAGIGHRSRHGQSAPVGVMLMYGSSTLKKLFERADPTENTRPAQSIVSYSPVPRLIRGPAFFDFNTFNARVINGSMPFSISIFLLSSLMWIGTPLPS